MTTLIGLKEDQLDSKKVNPTQADALAKEAAVSIKLILEGRRREAGKSLQLRDKKNTIPSKATPRQVKLPRLPIPITKVVHSKKNSSKDNEGEEDEEEEDEEDDDDDEDMELEEEEEEEEDDDKMETEN